MSCAPARNRTTTERDGRRCARATPGRHASAGGVASLELVSSCNCKDPIPRSPSHGGAPRSTPFADKRFAYSTLKQYPCPIHGQNGGVDKNSDKIFVQRSQRGTLGANYEIKRANVRFGPYSEPWLAIGSRPKTAHIRIAAIDQEVSTLGKQNAYRGPATGHETR